jgi:hypothetical protein
MKRLTLSILSLLLLGTFVFAQDEVTIEDLDARVQVLEERALYLTGSATVMWGLSGQLIDNSDNWLGEIPSNDLFAETDDNPLWPYNWTISAEATDEDGNVIVSAEAEVDMEEQIFDFPEDGEEDVSYVIIEFPNLGPGMVGLALEDSDVLEIDVHEVSSETESPRATFTITPMDGLEAKVGIVYDSMQTMNRFYDNVDLAALMATDFGPADLNLGALLDAFDDNATDSTSWNAGNYADIAVSLQVAYEMALGETDSITATLGLIYDTAYFNHVYVDNLEMTDALTADIYIEEIKGPKVAKNWDLTKDDMSDIMDDLQDGNVWGYATVPIGVQVAVDMMGIEATLNFMTRLVNGWDVMNPDEGKDFDYTAVGEEMDTDYELGAPRAYAMPMYVGFDAAYEMDMGGMTIAPTANFKFSSDFYKIGFDDPDDMEAIEYKGDVAGAEYVGRQMSAGAGVEVTGISDMIDVSLSGSVGFGFGAGVWDWPFDAYYNAVDWTKDITGRIKEQNKIQTDLEKDAKDADIDEYMANNLLMVDDLDAFMVEIGLTATPIDNLTIENTFSYIHDGLGFYYINDEEDATLMDYSWAVGGWDESFWLDQIENETNIEYDIMVSGAVGCTLYGDFTYTKVNYIGENGRYAKGWDKDTETFWIWDSEETSMSTFDYEIGVKVEVDVYSKN